MSNVHPSVTAALPAAAKAAAVQQSLVAESIGRGDMVKTALLALITGRPAFYLGPPGTNKTGTVQALAQRITGAIFHEELMPTVVSVEQLFVASTSIEEETTPSGGKSIRTRDTLGRAATAHVFFADEIWKADPRTLQALLDLAKGDGVRHDGQLVKTPLKAFFAASNELPEPEGNLGALWSRMTIRALVAPLDRAGILALMESRMRRYRGQTNGAPATLTLSELDQLRAARPFVEVSRDIRIIVVDLLESLRDETAHDFSWLWSDNRRHGRIIDVLQAAALVAGRSEVTKADLAVCEWLFWDTPEQIPVVKAKLAPLCRTPLMDAEEAVQALLAPGGKVALALAGNRQEAVKAVAQIEVALKQLAELRIAAAAGDHAAIDTLLRLVEQTKTDAIAKAFNVKVAAS